MFGWNIPDIGLEKPNLNQTGATASERYLIKLCRKSFLSLWSFANPYTDRGKSNTNLCGKELCDLLVIFGNDVIIFSDKSCEVPNTGDINLDWARWYRKSIRNSADQIYGAERWIKEHSNRIFTDRFCNQKLPLSLPSHDNIRIHRVVLAMGAKHRVERHFGKGSRGSLLINSALSADDHINASHPLYHPFSVGKINPGKGFVHVLDDISLDLIMEELDTVHDFIEYLVSKENFLMQDKFVWAAGEEELLGFYIQNLLVKKANGLDVSKVLPINEFKTIIIPENTWSYYVMGELRHIREHLRDQSKFWDALIEHFSHFSITGALRGERIHDLPYHERNIRFLAQEPRISRAMMSQAIQYKLATTPHNRRSAILFQSRDKQIGFLFLIFPKNPDWDYETYRTERQAALAIYCHVAKYKYSAFRYMVGISTEPLSSGKSRSEDLAVYDYEDWTKEDNETARRISKSENILTELRVNSFSKQLSKQHKSLAAHAKFGDDFILLSRAERRAALSKKVKRNIYPRRS